MRQSRTADNEIVKYFTAKTTRRSLFLPRLRLIDSAFMITSFYPFALELRAQGFLLFGVSVKHFFFIFLRLFKGEREVVAMNHLLVLDYFTI